METPSELETAARDRAGITISKREYDGETVIAVDFGPTGDEPAVDVVGGTAIVVVDDEQYEFDVPGDASDIVVNDGILTIRERSGEAGSGPESESETH